MQKLAIIHNNGDSNDVNTNDK